MTLKTSASEAAVINTPVSRSLVPASSSNSTTRAPSSSSYSSPSPPKPAPSAPSTPALTPFSITLTSSFKT